MKKKEPKIRRCFVCKKYKSLESFWKDKSRILGREYRCKSCYLTPQYRLSRKIWGTYTYKRRRETLLRYYKNNTENIKARRAVWTAVKNGTLKKSPCKTCKKLPSFAHHYKGYKRKNRLDIKWLCQYHHTKEHK